MGESSGSVSVDVEMISFGGKLVYDPYSEYYSKFSYFKSVLQLGAAPFSSDEPVLSVDQLADQVAEVLDFFGLVSAMCFGVTAGAYVLTLFAVIKEYLLQRYFSKVQACGSVVTEEQPQAVLIPMEYFLMGYGLYRPSQLSYSPRSPLTPSCISPELLSPESMGLKLKPIKTRISLEV
ncbi:hypothetical protein B296_00022453 [Ensete ventricosum]|uniref:Uncharacterized protein n=1 Tax=Ensete ventricosum TaxID=4639 RepID=A0A426ZEG5_ENSVE|nr:hypothetical protein B296_00022453 [Ensete ventricosum]